MQRRLTIHHVLTSFHIGGGERVALDLAAQQVTAGHEVSVVSLEAPGDGPLAAEFLARGVSIIRQAKRPVGVDPILAVRLGRVFRRHSVDVVHTHNPLPLIYAAAAGRVTGARVVHTKHGVNEASLRLRRLRSVAARFVHSFVAVSEDTAEVARSQRDCTPDRLSVVRNGIDLSRFGPDDQARRAVRAELGIPEDAWVVGTVGRVVGLKNHALLVRAMSALLGDKTRLVVVGDGPEMNALKAAVAELAEPDHVHLLGARMDVPRVLRAFDTFCLSSTEEGLPLVVPEAMATGLPVVCTAVGGLPRVVDEGETGYLVPSEDEVALRGRLEQLAADRSLARSMGRRARKVAHQRYSMARMADQYHALYTGGVR